MNKVDFLELSVIRKEINKVSKSKLSVIYNFIEHYLDDVWSLSQKLSRIRIFVAILENNTEDFFSLYKRYFETTSRKEKILIKNGGVAQKEYITTLKKRPKITHKYSTFSKEYWIEKKNYTEKEAILKIKEISQHALNQKKIHGRKSKLPPNSIGHWIDKGYTLEEANALRRPYVEKSILSLNSFIAKYGTDGERRFNEMREKRDKTLMEKYGTTIFLCAGISKESIKFFIPIYKELRKLGIKRDDICWGIKGSKEFTTRHNNKNYAYDFTIKSIKIIIEYNNEFWHCHPERIWRGFIDKDIAIQTDILKKEIMEERGFEVIAVWNFDNLSERQQFILQKVKDILSNV